MDAVDAALVDLSGGNVSMLAGAGLPIQPALRGELLGLCHGAASTLEQVARLDVEMGRMFVTAAQALLDSAGIDPAQVTAIGSHGQTIYHQPLGASPTSVQLGDPNLIAELTGITTVADFRRRDIAAGGQGAPLVPAFHRAVFYSSERERVVLNIGGIANITVLPRDSGQPVIGFDTGPGNALMDAWAMEHLGTPRDDDGRWSASGTINEYLLAALLDDPYFALAPPKSTGREYFHLDWLRKVLRRGGMETLLPQDIQATLCELTAASITRAIAAFAPDTQQMLVCGGGVHNSTLMRRLRSLSKDYEVASTATFGIDPDWVEAIAFAWLAKQTLENKPGNLPSVTGARRAVVLGGVYRA